MGLVFRQDGPSVDPDLLAGRLVGRQPPAINDSIGHQHLAEMLVQEEGEDHLVVAMRLFNGGNILLDQGNRERFLQDPLYASLLPEPDQRAGQGHLPLPERDRDAATTAGVVGSVFRERVIRGNDEVSDPAYRLEHLVHRLEHDNSRVDPQDVSGGRVVPAPDFPGEMLAPMWAERRDRDDLDSASGERPKGSVVESKVIDANRRMPRPVQVQGPKQSQKRGTEGLRRPGDNHALSMIFPVHLLTRVFPIYGTSPGAGTGSLDPPRFGRTDPFLPVLIVVRPPVKPMENQFDPFRVQMLDHAPYGTFHDVNLRCVLQEHAHMEYQLGDIVSDDGQVRLHIGFGDHQPPGGIVVDEHISSRQRCQFLEYPFLLFRIALPVTLCETELVRHIYLFVKNHVASPRDRLI